MIAGRPRTLVLRTAGTNCDRETVLALEQAGSEVDVLHLHRLLEDPDRLARYAALVVPGGFSYGDDVAAGRVFGLELRHHLLAPLRAFVDRGGVVLGVCNGFQVLVDTGLLDGTADAPRRERGYALHANASNRFECRWVTLRAEECACPWLEPGDVLPMPAAHGEGRFLVRDTAVLERLRANGQIALRYVSSGAPDAPAEYPDNPNGSVDGIAGLCDPTGRVLGLMPHPERNVSPFHHPLWTRQPRRSEGEGLRFYRRMIEFAARSA